MQYGGVICPLIGIHGEESAGPEHQPPYNLISLWIFPCSLSKVYTSHTAHAKVTSLPSLTSRCPCSRESVLAWSESLAVARRPWHWPSCATLVPMAAS